jgi:hypothetical protein
VNAAAALAALALLAAPARAGGEAAPAALTDMAPSRSMPGWARQGNSLLLYAEDGSLQQEIPLSAADTTAASSREMLGGASPDARVAWTLERKLVFSPGRAKLLESRRQFKTYGTSGQELWRDDSVDSPERGEPVIFSADGKTLLLSRRTGDEWTAEARTWLGAPLALIGPFPRLISMALTPSGRYALARWRVPDKSDTHTFLDLTTKRRRDVPSSDLVLGLARVGDDGVVRSGSKIVFAFEDAVSTSSPAAVSTAPAAAPPAAPK